MLPLPFCFIVCCHSHFLQQQCYLFNFYLSLNFCLCSAFFNTFLFFTSVESLICSCVFWNYTHDTTGGVSDPYYLKASRLYFQFTALIPIWFHDIKKEKDCDLLQWRIQVAASKSLLSPNTIMAPDIMKICLHQFIFFIFFHSANSSVVLPSITLDFFCRTYGRELARPWDWTRIGSRLKNFPVSCVSLEFAYT